MKTVKRYINPPSPERMREIEKMKAPKIVRVFIDQRRSRRSECIVQ